MRYQSQRERLLPSRKSFSSLKKAIFFTSDFLEQPIISRLAPAIVFLSMTLVDGVITSMRSCGARWRKVAPNSRWIKEPKSRISGRLHSARSASSTTRSNIPRFQSLKILRPKFLNNIKIRWSTDFAVLKMYRVFLTWAWYFSNNLY